MSRFGANGHRRLLSHLNQAVTSGKQSLTAVASNDKLWLRRNNDFSLSSKYQSLKGIAQLGFIVEDLVRSLTQVISLPTCEDAVCEGDKRLGRGLDKIHIANLLHLLLCLRHQLSRLLVAKVVETVRKHVLDCQRDQSKRTVNWFFEYPNAQHPLSTTWPWSIRPSLAVLWGVCWMFYDHNRHSPNKPHDDVLRFDHDWNMVNEQGQVLADSRPIIQFLSTLQQQHQGFYPGIFRQDTMMPRVPRSSLPPGAGLAAQHAATAFSHSPSPSESLSPNRQRSSSIAWHSSTPLLTQQAGASVATPVRGTNELALHATNTTTDTYPAAPSAYHAWHAPQDPSNNNWLPEDVGFSISTTSYPADVNASWPHTLAPHPIPDQHAAAYKYPAALPPRPRNPLTSSISVTTDFHQNFAGLPPQQPQDTSYSATPVSASSLHPHDSFAFPSYHPSQLSPQPTGFMPPISDQQDMRTPPRSPQATGIDDSNPRKRSHSIMSNGPPMHPQSAGSRSGSVTSMPPHSGDEYSNLARSTFKRNEAPPMNADHKYVCDYSIECRDLVFDRKCEWSKHMDKHDRPYRCHHASCAKLQGFTYSGGLLRHEREVHGKHGGPKAQLMCPFEDCKRHSGKGFTRKENLNEHIRRVHQSKDLLSPGMALKRDGLDAFPGADEMQTPGSEAFDRDEQLSPMRKRRRVAGMSESIGPDDIESLKMEIESLRQQNAEKDTRIMQMELKSEEDRLSREEEMRKLHDSIRQLQQQQQSQVAV